MVKFLFCPTASEGSDVLKIRYIEILSTWNDGPHAAMVQQKWNIVQ